MTGNNIKNGVKTTVLGSFLIALAVAYFTTPYINDSFTYDVNEWYSISLLISGVGLLVAPDNFISFMFGWLQKFTKK
jgi:hypothetical protein